MWAVEWLWESLGLRLQSFLLEITQEMENTRGVSVSSLDHESTCEPLQSLSGDALN